MLESKPDPFGVLATELPMPKKRNPIESMLVTFTYDY